MRMRTGGVPPHPLPQLRDASHGFALIARGSLLQSLPPYYQSTAVRFQPVSGHVEAAN
jgi:hypothetical protein